MNVIFELCQKQDNWDQKNKNRSEVQRDESLNSNSRQTIIIMIYFSAEFLFNHGFLITAYITALSRL